MAAGEEPRHGVTYPVKLGDSFKLAPPDGAGDEFTSFKYDWKVGGGDATKRGRVKRDRDGNKVTVQFQNVVEGERAIRYQGVYVSKKDDGSGGVECALIFDGETGFKLERLGGTVKSLKITRDDESSEAGIGVGVAENAAATVTVKHASATAAAATTTMTTGRKMSEWDLLEFEVMEEAAAAVAGDAWSAGRAPAQPGRHSDGGGWERDGHADMKKMRTAEPRPMEADGRKGDETIVPTSSFAQFMSDGDDDSSSSDDSDTDSDQEEDILAPLAENA